VNEGNFMQFTFGEDAWPMAINGGVAFSDLLILINLATFSNSHGSRGLIAMTENLFFFSYAAC
jgi:hypothetical protein